jgi:hypothetical protein
MSTLRYCGSIRIRVTYIDQPAVSYVDGKLDPKNWYADGTPRYPNGSYRCHVVAGDGARCTVIVAPPAALTKAVDCPEAFDEAAGAALSFASNPDEDDPCPRCKPHRCTCFEGAEMNAELSAWAIRRKAPQAPSRKEVV